MAIMMDKGGAFAPRDNSMNNSIKISIEKNFIIWEVIATPVKNYICQIPICFLDEINLMRN